MIISIAKDIGINPNTEMNLLNELFDIIEKMM